MTNINWSEIPDATEDNKRAADLLIRLDSDQERRTRYDGGWIYLHDATHTVDNKQSVARYGARFFLLCSENVMVWDKAIFLQRTHSP